MSGAVDDMPSYAHQRQIADRFAVMPMRSFADWRDHRERIESLDGYRVEEIGKLDAQSLILKYEWLGNIGRANLFIGLLSPRGELHGVAAFGEGPNGARLFFRRLIDREAICLERGACVHYAPRNAASYLISRACKLVHKLTRIHIFFAYADPTAGEYGAVYQATNWTYLGQGDLNRKGKKRVERYMVCRPCDDPDDPRNWRVTADLRRAGRHLGWEEARKLGWRIEQRPSKHVYALHIGHWRECCPQWPGGISYPAPHPELKNSLLALAGECRM